MYPEQYSTNQGAGSSKWLRIGITAVVLLVVLVVGWSVYQAMTFHIVRTDPKLSSVSAESPYVKLYFNKELSSSGLSVKTTSFTMRGYTINNKTLEIRLPIGGLVAGRKYSVVLKHVASTDNKIIENKTITFTARDIPSPKLSSEQRKALLDQQDQYPYSVTSINFKDFDVLYDHGLTADQLQAVKDDIYGYSVQINQEFQTIALQTDSIQSKIHDSSVGDFNDTTSFAIQTPQASFEVQLVSNVVSGDVSVVMLDASGAQVYDSANAHD